MFCPKNYIDIDTENQHFNGIRTTNCPVNSIV